jgi:hypothetical protein
MIVDLTITPKKLLEVLLKSYLGEDYTDEKLEKASIYFLKEGSSTFVEEIKVNIKD